MTEEVKKHRCLLVVRRTYRLLIFTHLKNTTALKVLNTLHHNLWVFSEFPNHKRLVGEQISISASDAHERCQLKWLAQLILVLGQSRVDERGKAAFKEEGWHKVHAVVGEDKIAAPVLVFLVELDSEVFLDLSHLEAEAFDLLLHKYGLGAYCHVGLQPRLDLQVVVDDGRLL